MRSSRLRAAFSVSENCKISVRNADGILWYTEKKKGEFHEKKQSIFGIVIGFLVSTGVITNFLPIVWAAFGIALLAMEKELFWRNRRLI